MMREIVLDTETTGLDPASGHRIVEIAALELLHHVPSGRTFREYLNPERDVPPEAERIHGLSAEFLKDKPLFKAIAPAFLDFVADAPLIEALFYDLSPGDRAQVKIPKQAERRERDQIGRAHV